MVIVIVTFDMPLGHTLGFQIAYTSAYPVHFFTLYIKGDLMVQVFAVDNLNGPS